MKLNPLAGRGNEYLFTPEGSKTIWVSRSKKGFGRRQRSLRTENALEARQRRDELFADWLGEKPVVHKKVKLFASEHWVSWAKTKERKSKATRDSIHFSGKHLIPMIADLYPEQVNENWWETVYIPTKLSERPGRKFFNDWKWLTTFLHHLHREGVIERLPRFENPDGDRAQGLFLSDSDIAALYAAANQDLTLQIDLGFKHFMRRSEVLLLPWAEIDFERGLIEIPAPRTKIRKGRTIPLRAETLEALRARKQGAESPFVFPNPLDPAKPVIRTGNATAWRGAVARARAAGSSIDPKATFHDLRHSGLTRAFAATNRYVEICVVAGLSLEEAQRTYLHLKPEHTRFVSDLVAVSDA